MNILLLCDEYPPGRHGGIGTVVQMQAREMVRQGHNVVVSGFYDWGYGGEDEFVDNGVKVYRFRRGLNSNLLNKQDALHVRAMYRLLRTSGLFQKDIKKSMKRYQAHVEQLITDHSIDIIEIADYNDYIRFCNSYIPYPKFSVPVVAKLHGSLTYYGYMDGNHVPQPWQQMEHDILEQADSVCSVSKYRADMAKKIGEYSGPIKILYNGINRSEIGSYETKYPNRVVFTGSLMKKKGIYQLMKAWNIVNDQMPDAELYIFGKGPIETIKEELTSAAKDTVHFKGHVDRSVLFQYLGEARAAIFPSFAESFALGPMEAMACGTAIIYTSLTSGPELITNEVDGLLVDPADEQEMATQMLRLLQDDTLANELANKGKEHVASNFDISVVVQKHIDYYRDVLAKHG